MADDEGTGRNRFLINGRRVTVTDLLAASLIEPDAKLMFERPRFGEIHYATVTPTGRIRLAEGGEFSSPSAAAQAAAGAGGLAGWRDWILISTGETLNRLRQRLLDQVSGATQQPGESEAGEVSVLVTPHEMLREAIKSAGEGRSTILTVRDLIAHWEALRRGHLVNAQIEADLYNHGVTTSPDFRTVTLETHIKIIELALSETETAGVDPLADSDNSKAVMDIGLTLGNLPSALGGVESVDPNASIQEAITKMLLNDYSQLAVMQGNRHLAGEVTWRSIAQALHFDSDATLADATVPTREHPYDRELIDVLNIIYDEDFVFVRNVSKEICGIVTAADVVDTYGDMAVPFQLIGELDRLLRLTLEREFDLEEVIAVCDPGATRDIEAFDELTIGDYQRVLEHHGCWDRVGWRLDRKVFIARLDELRMIRNDITHFNPDPIPQDAVELLRNMIKLLKDLCGS